MNVEVLKFENLIEFLKPVGSQYILKIKLDSEKAIYYSIIDGACFVYLVFCIDKDYSGNIKVENGKICLSAVPTGTTVAIAQVAEDSLVAEIIKKFKIDVK